MPQELGQVFINLIINARDAMRDKKIDQNEALIIIKTAYNPKTKQLEASFKDNGTGIREDVLTKIFDPFFTTKGFGMGTGLGLNLSHLIVEAHDGWVKVDSEYGVGTTFTVLLSTEMPRNRKGQKKS